LELHDEVFTDLGTAVKREPLWLIEGLVPTGLVFVGAPPKTMKSSVSLAIALLVAGYKCKALPEALSHVNLGGPVLIFSAEADAGELRWMAEDGLGVRVLDNGGIRVATEPHHFKLDTEKGMVGMLGWLKELQPRLAIVDPLINFHSSNENDSSEMTSILSPLRRWAVENEATMMVVHHAKKLNEDRTTYDNSDLRGSSAFFGLANGVLIFTPKPQNQLFVRATFKRGASWERTITFGAYGNRGANPQDELTEQESEVLEAVPRVGLPRSSEALLKALSGFDRPALAPIIVKLCRNGYIVSEALGYRRL
jgi:hypothetical protein